MSRSTNRAEKLLENCKKYLLAYFKTKITNHLQSIEADSSKQNNQTAITNRINETKPKYLANKCKNLNKIWLSNDTTVLYKKYSNTTLLYDYSDKLIFNFTEPFIDYESNKVTMKNYTNFNVGDNIYICKTYVNIKEYNSDYIFVIIKSKDIFYSFDVNYIKKKLSINTPSVACNEMIKEYVTTTNKNKNKNKNTFQIIVSSTLTQDIITNIKELFENLHFETDDMCDYDNCVNYKSSDFPVITKINSDFISKLTVENYRFWTLYNNRTVRTNNGGYEIYSFDPTDDHINAMYSISSYLNTPNTDNYDLYTDMYYALIPKESTISTISMVSLLFKDLLKGTIINNPRSMSFSPRKGILMTPCDQTTNRNTTNTNTNSTTSTNQLYTLPGNNNDNLNKYLITIGFKERDISDIIADFNKINNPKQANHTNNININWAKSNTNTTRHINTRNNRKNNRKNTLSAIIQSLCTHKNKYTKKNLFTIFKPKTNTNNKIRHCSDNLQKVYNKHYQNVPPVTTL